MNADAVRLIVKEEIANAVAPSGLIGIAIDAPNEMLAAQVTSIVDRLKMLEKVEADMEKSNPFLAYERGCSPEELLFAWKKLLIDQDVMSNFADQMSDAAATNVMAAWCTNKSDPDLIRLKEAVALKNAPRTSWKMLCLSSHGGGPEKLVAGLFARMSVRPRSVRPRLCSSASLFVRSSVRPSLFVCVCSSVAVSLCLFVREARACHAWVSRLVGQRRRDPFRPWLPASTTLLC